MELYNQGGYLHIQRFQDNEQMSNVHIPVATIFCGAAFTNGICLWLVSVAAKHKETKQFYTLYNTLDDTKLYLDKEVNNKL